MTDEKNVIKSLSEYIYENNKDKIKKIKDKLDYNISEEKIKEIFGKKIKELNSIQKYNLEEYYEFNNLELLKEMIYFDKDDLLKELEKELCKNKFNERYTHEEIIDIISDFRDMNKKYDLIPEKDLTKLNSLIISLYNSELYKPRDLKILINFFNDALKLKISDYEYKNYDDLLAEILKYNEAYRKGCIYLTRNRLKIIDKDKKYMLGSPFYGGILFSNINLIIVIIVIIIIVLIIIILIIKLKK